MQLKKAEFITQIRKCLKEGYFRTNQDKGWTKGAPTIQEHFNKTYTLSLKADEVNRWFKTIEEISKLRRSTPRKKAIKTAEAVSDDHNSNLPF